jgi:multidrug efflux system membrane fusion protein
VGGDVMTDIRGKKKRSPLGILLALLLTGVAVAIWIKVISVVKPSTDDASIDADIIHVAFPVGGRIIQLPIVENQLVHKGDLLFRIDPVPYQTNVAEAKAQLDIALGALGSKRRLATTEQTNATIADSQIKRAKTNLDLAMRREKRLEPLTAKGYIPRQQFDQAVSARHDAETSLREAQEREQATKEAVDTDDAATASVRAASATLAGRWLIRRCSQPTTEELLASRYRQAKLSSHHNLFLP